MGQGNRCYCQPSHSREDNLRCKIILKNSAGISTTKDTLTAVSYHVAGLIFFPAVAPFSLLLYLLLLF